VAAKNQPVIIVKKRRPHAHPHHGGAWKVAYADFVTAMMAFFLVMWIIGQSNAVKASIAGYFKDPGIFEHQLSNGILPGAALRVDPASQDRLREVKDGAPAGDLREALERTGRAIKEMLTQTPEFQAVQHQVQVSVTADGLRIELIEGDRPTFFDSGSAILKEPTKALLAELARELGKLQNPVVLEGHTDATPFAQREGYTNWELSADRANAARRAMEATGLRPSQIQGVRGYAAMRPRHENALDARNRRVSIVVPHGVDIR